MDRLSHKSLPSLLRCLWRTDDYVVRLQATSRRAQMDSGGNWLTSIIHSNLASAKSPACCKQLIRWYDHQAHVKDSSFCDSRLSITDSRRCPSTQGPFTAAAAASTGSNKVGTCGAAPHRCLGVHHL